MSGLTVKRLVAGYGGEPVLREVDLEVPEGGLLAVLGPSGCGKTTLLRVLAGFHPVSSGEVWLGERQLDLGGAARAARDRDRAAGRRVVPASQRGGQRRVRASARRTRRAGRGAARPGGARRVRRADAGAALRRSGAAGGARPCARARTWGGAARRAVLGVGRGPARGAPGGRAGHVEGGRRDGVARDARPGGGARDRRSRRGAARRRGGAAREATDDLRLPRRSRGGVVRGRGDDVRRCRPLRPVETPLGTLPTSGDGPGTVLLRPEQLVLGPTGVSVHCGRRAVPRA